MISVIIPTLNEAAYLPRLLEALARQIRPPDEVIVADAGSKDGTPEIARAWGARVVPGGRPAVGRNAGARVARGTWLVFLDADVVPRPDFLEKAMKEIEARGLDIATCLMEPLSPRPTDRVFHEVANGYLLALQWISPRAPGFCILVRRALHEAIGGFDETLLLAEDHDYVRRASRHGRFGVLTTVRIPVSTRRLEEEGVFPLLLKYLWAEAHVWAGRPIRSLPFAYAFGHHRPSPHPGGYAEAEDGEEGNRLALPFALHPRSLMQRMGSWPRRPHLPRKTMDHAGSKAKPPMA
ncbi:PGL/p-HBAD biosynthesis glycosyltransferase [Candidatus Thermoflexus japonica]|uniref:4,4'-diaponeurosporenoate glycosyltransferase n=1 Tax=Candidatus Thermoflexus japonica TaxID=2035417 RepID=A0A2H5Y449_9CHLR|nr:PGL/p-HBAD biosynthesis glycosyltransferase [Candidatus Thermoflexus japonica]